MPAARQVCWSSIRAKSIASSTGMLYGRELAEVEHTDISAYGGWRAYMARTDST
jgi:hypothetical protein